MTCTERACEVEWAAGMFEGEGTITIAVRNSDQTYRLVVSLVNTDAEIIEFFQRLWPGWRQPVYGERPRRQPAWTWTRAGPRAEQFLAEIRPALRTIRVRRKADLAMEFRVNQSLSQTVRNKPGYKARQRELYLQMKQLNLRGAAAVALAEAASS